MLKCELCIDPIGKPHIDEFGTKRWRACTNKATHVAAGSDGLLVCREHSRRGDDPIDAAPRELEASVAFEVAAILDNAQNRGPEE